MKISWLASRGLLLLTLFLTMAGAARAEKPPIVIGFAIAKSGWFAPNDSVSDAAELAIQDINAKGGLLGRKIVTVYADSKSDPVQAAKAAMDVLSKGADLVIVSCDYDMGSPAALAAARAGKIAWSLCASESRISRLGPYVFTIGPPAQSIGAGIVEWGYEEKGYRNLFVLLDNTVEYTRELCFGMKSAWSGLKGATIVGSDTFKNGDPSIATQIARLKNTKPAPDAIALCTYPPGGINVVRQLRAAGVTTPILANDAMDGSFWLNAVPNLKDFYVPTVGSVYGDDPRAEINDVYTRLKAKTGRPPVFGYSYLGYADIQLWARAVERAKTLDSKAVTKVLESFSGEPSLIGPITFTKGLHIATKYKLEVVSVEHGTRKYVGSIQPSTIFSKAALLGSK
jgi:branched-chain amino acid transport system substrate-binding protein